MLNRLIENKKGITLIALVITIVVLLILTSASISMLAGDNGIIKKAQKAKEETNYSIAYDELSQKILGMQIAKNGKGTLDDIKNDSEYTIKDENNNEIYIIYKGYEFKIDSSFQITPIGKYESEENNDEVSYTTDHLVLNLDAIQNTPTGHKNDTDTWYDISDPNKTATKSAGSSCWNDDSLILNGATYFTVDSPVDNSYGTVEVCLSIPETFKPVSSSFWFSCSTIFGCDLYGCQKDWAIIIDENGYFAIGYDFSTILTSNVLALDGKNHTIVYTYMPGNLVFAIDGQIIKNIEYTPSGNICEKFGIGWNEDSDSTAIECNIHSIRFYDKELTDDEIQNNYQSNIKRYKSDFATDLKPEYSLNGLKMQLDGIQNTESGHSDSTNIWYNKINSNSYNATMTSGTVSWNNNSLYLDGSTYFTVDSPVDNSYGTVEVCLSIPETFKPVNSSTWFSCSTIFGCELPWVQKDWAIIIDGNGNIAIGYDNSTIFSSNVSALDGKIHTISYRYMPGNLVLAIDGKIIQKIEYTPSGDICQKFGIGWNNSESNTAITGNIYSVRFYDDLLPSYEIYKNYLMDKEMYK